MVAAGEILVEVSLPALAVALAAINSGVMEQARTKFFRVVPCISAIYRTLMPLSASR